VSLDKARILESLRAEDVANFLGIKGPWHGRWMRSATCPVMHHSGDAFAISRDGKIACHACDYGGGLLDALALGQGLGSHDGKRVTISDFPRVLEIAAGIAGVEDDFGPVTKPKPPERPPAPPLPPLHVRLDVARKRAAWIWQRLFSHEESSMPEQYLRLRGLDPARVMKREKLRATPLRLTPEQRDAIDRNDPSVSKDLRTLWWTLGTRRGTMSLVAPVRHVDDGSFVDLRARRLEPEEGQPKIIGMVGGVTTSPAERGSTRRLIGCYGNPHAIESDHVIIVEGMVDYLTGLALWPNAQILGAVDAGSIALLARHAAKALAYCDPKSRLTIVEQDDPPRTLESGKVVTGAADQSINEQPTAAAKTAIGLLGPRRVGWLFCDPEHSAAAGGKRELDGKPVKDLNDVMRAGADVDRMFVWWPNPPSAR
jgi:hypothetical protein